MDNLELMISQPENLEKTITLIPAKPKPTKRDLQTIQLRVAAYCRVSTDEEEQLTSYNTQINHYTDVINQNPNWTLVGVFADEGITGTSAKKRGEFMKLMGICKKGKVDLILTKSISRFSRNTLDAITYVRNLKAMGVGVIFEKENISTLDMSNEMVFTMLSAFAQAESESISENVKFGRRHSFKKGKIPFQYSRILGYERGEDGKPKIVPEQADIVTRIFALYIAGASIAQIKHNLENAGIPSASGKPEWSQSVINYMLKNEKYIGDALLQKTYVVDCISKEVRKNNGAVTQYYVHNNHEAIIPRDIFYRVQEEMARRNAKRRVAEKNVITERGKYSSKYALTELMECGECGTRYRRVTWARNGKVKIVWRCINRLDYGKKYCKNSPSIEESILHEAICKAISKMIAQKDDVIADFSEMIQDTVDNPNSQFDRIAIEKQIEDLELRIKDIATLIATSESSMDGLFQMKDLYDRIGALRELCKQDDERKATVIKKSSRMNGLLKELELDSHDLTVYDDAFSRRIIEKVTVVSKHMLRVTFMGGYVVEQEMSE